MGRFVPRGIWFVSRGWQVEHSTMVELISAAGQNAIRANQPG